MKNVITKILNVPHASILSLLLIWATSANALDAPPDLRGTEVGQAQVKWEWQAVVDAVEYELTVDGVNLYQTEETQFSSYNLWVGEHSLTVRAKNEEGEFSDISATAKIVVSDWFDASSYNVSRIVGQDSSSSSPQVAAALPVDTSDETAKAVFIAAPDNVTGVVTGAGSVQWGWAQVPDATEYQVTVDGHLAASISETSYSSTALWEGDHSMTVIAVNANGDQSEQSATVKLWVGIDSTPLAQVDSTSESTSISDSAASPPPEVASATPDDSPSAENRVDPVSYQYDEVYNKDGYDLVFSDEFNGSSLNSFRWNTGLRWDGEYNGERYEYRVINQEDQLYVNIYSEDEEHLRDVVPYHNPFELDGSRLAIRAVRNPLKTNNNNLAFGSMDEMVSQQNFLSGAIATHGKFSQKFGYFEARIKIPSHVGAFPAFWLFHENSVAQGTQKTEIDIMENLGHAPSYVYNTFHYYKDVSATNSGAYTLVKPYPDGQIFTGVDYSQDYHVYAVEWSPGKIVWLIDGEQVSEYESDEVNFEELYLKLNLAIGGMWTSYPETAGGLGRSYPNQDDIDSFQNPALEIDYVRVYKKN